MSILKLINEPAEKLTEQVKHRGTTYTLSGYPDATKLQHIVLMTPSDQEKRARHWSKFTGSEFDAKLILHIMLVAETLEHEEDPERRYDEVEIAMLATKQAGLFLSLVGAASKILGFSDGEGVNDILAGESGGEKGTNSSSPS